MKKGKKYQAAAKLVDSTKLYTIAEAAELVKQTSTVKFDATIGVSFRLNVDPKQADQQIRGTLILPHGNGKTKKVLAITNKVEEAKAAGADYVGGKEMLEKIQKENWFDFDVIIATPDMMGVIGRLGKILGPKGLMPNPKAGTVTTDVARAVNDAKAGKIEYRLDKTNIIHCIIGKASFGAEKLSENFEALLGAIIKAKPAASKGQYIRSCVIASTMGPGIRVSTSKIG